jgi:uncharacterized membrane protein YfcA
MPDLSLIAGVFLLAGFVKGVIGLGLPTIAMGLLALIMPTAKGAALLIVPSLVTNVWQMLAGGHLVALVRRLWPMLLGVCFGTWAGAGLMTGAYSQYGRVLLGIALMLYALSSVRAGRWSLAPSQQHWLGPVAGVATGLITAATGVFVIPAVPYLQAIGLEKDELVQALGLAFTLSTLALAGNLAAAGLSGDMLAPATLLALAMAAAGMGLGQLLRLRLKPRIFTALFFAGLFALGFYLSLRALT